MPLDHFCICVPEDKKDNMATFLVDSMKHMGFKEFYRPAPHVIGMGDASPYFWITGVDVKEGELQGQEAQLKKQHIAFSATNIEQVNEFHAAALKAGATCNGPPGPRPQYHPNYYGAYVRDPLCGINFEVVYHKHDAAA